MASARSSRTARKRSARTTQYVSWFAWTRKANPVSSRQPRLRRISVSDYVRTVTVAQARREILAAREANHRALS